MFLRVYYAGRFYAPIFFFGGQSAAPVVPDFVRMPVSRLIDDRLKRATLRFCTLWVIERTDGVTFHLTDHDQKILHDGNWYESMAGFNSSAKQFSDGFRENNLEATGIISSSVVTEEDLRNGKYDHAKITETVVDWMFPWVGQIMSNTYYILRTTYGRGVWIAHMVGLTGWLNKNSGEVVGRVCPYKLGDPNTCRVNLATWTDTGAITVVKSHSSERQLHFETDLVTVHDGVYDLGVITWLTGPNAGEISEVKSYLKTNGDIWLQMKLPKVPTVGDTFSITRGCDGNYSTCKDVFANLINFGGFSTCPGNIRARMDQSRA